jgi:predicted nucleotidyltransferase
MEKVGIICEYNPFHNGHIYHLQKIKEMYPDSMIILVMSTSFTMRGEISILNKWDKTSIALKYGIDLVIELPTFYSTNSADTFASGAITLLSYMDCDYLVFGSEINDIDLLTELAEIQLNNKEYDNLVKEYMDKGNNYPTSQGKALKDICGKTINLPNDLLGLSYIKEIIKQKSKIKPISILRTNDYHTEGATSIRNNILNNVDIKGLVPKETLDKIITTNTKDKYFSLLKYKILSDMNNLNTYLDIDEGLDSLIRKNIIKANSLDELIEKIKTKRYTYNRLNRMFIHILLNIKKTDVSKLKKINYIRVLGFNKTGKKYLKEIREKINIPIITNYSDIDDNNLNFELYVTYIYNEIINRNDLNLIELKSIPKEIK